MKRAIKLFKAGDNGLAKKIPYPDNFSQLIKSVREYAEINEPNKKYELIEEETKREIEDQGDFELMTKDYINKKTVRIRINIVDKTKEDLINDTIANNIESNINNNNLKEIKKEENKYTIPEEIKNNFRKKLNELGEQFLAEIEKNLNTNSNSEKENSGQGKKLYCSKCKEEIKE